MKKGTIEFQYFEKGDYVRTPEGVGIVTEDELSIGIENISDLYYSQIRIKHKVGTSSNTSNNIIAIDRIMVTKITKEEYENDN
jgi:hypothetical protein